MTVTQFDRDSLANWYVKAHLKTDPGVDAIFFLPTNSGERDIRLLEINRLIGDRNDAALEPIDFGVDVGMDSEHRLFVLDVTPEQWERIKLKELALPTDWSLEGAISFKHE